ncbi:YjbE family putative metal transport protein [Sphingomonas sp. PR090111-T3T-6A]|uniref:YjbE family putative metal transport protein n=1 Tax=Sphingomonas sp. PR090111-T3T-6A TaxID=685778 RepID=UPI0003774C4B|nr:YjbE family putative metal transport protein [Sphingomonas sp. PR090111-T3T-6A]
MDFSDILTAGGLAALVQVLAIDLMLAGDNVVVLGTLVARLSPEQRHKVLAIGVGVALVCRIAFALVATQLLRIIGLLFAGGLLLLWVAWKLFRELRSSGQEEEGKDATRPVRGFRDAVLQVALADLSMSLDNVLGVAGAAREHPTVLFLGLAGSVALMAVAANLIAGFIERHRWIAYLGLAVILWVAGRMIWEGFADPDIGMIGLLR